MDRTDAVAQSPQGNDEAMDQLRDITPQWTVGGVLARVLLFAALWMILAEGNLRYWFLIAATVLVAAFVSLILVPTSGLRWSLMGVSRFVPFFIYQSVLGGLDVAARALSHGPKLNPVYAECRLRLEHEPVRVLVANTMSLMPGTLSVVLEEELLKLHVLDRELPAIERVREVEEHAARMFRLDLEPVPDDGLDHSGSDE